MKIDELTPLVVDIIVQWRDKSETIGFSIDTEKLDFKDYDKEKELAEEQDNWLVEAFESLNICVDDTIRNAEFRFDLRINATHIAYVAPIATVYCSHCGSKIDISVCAITKE